MDDPARYERAKRRVGEITGFYRPLLVYVLVNVLLFVLNILTSPGNLWFYWPLLGWGTGIVAHAALVFGSGRLWGESWRERKIKQLMEKEQHRADD
jgi:uncharacterized membrane protein YdjX (TVP38/TMEM64 family)